MNGAPTRTRSAARPGALGRALANTTTITARNLRRYKRVPTLLAFATVQPVMLVLLFTSVFGGAIQPPGVERYVDYVLPGILVLALGFGASQTGVAIAEDLNRGMIDRFRALPTARLAVLAGRTLADTVRNAFVIAVIFAIGTLQGFRFHAGAPAALGAIGIALAAGWAFSWACALLGLIIRDAESAGLVGLLVAILLIFTSSTFVPVETMPSALQAFAHINPLTSIVDALRALCLGGSTTRPVLEALAWIAGSLAVCIPLAAHRYRHATS